jgi:hypothetical protein
MKWREHARSKVEKVVTEALDDLNENQRFVKLDKER